MKAKTDTYKTDSRAYDAYCAMEDAGVLEDRREYDVEMLADSEGLDQYEAERLFDLIQNDFGTPEPISSAWSDITKYLLIKEGSGYNLADKGYERLGQYVWDYMTASICDMNWEGYNDVQLHGIKALLKDMAIGAEAEGKHGQYGKDEV